MNVFFLESDNYVENIDMFQELDTFIESVYTYDMQMKDLMIECIRKEYNSTLNESASDIWEAVKKFFKRIWQFCKDLLNKVKNFFSKLFRRNTNTVNEIKKTEQEITKIESEVKQTLKDSSNKTKDLSQRLDKVKNNISSASSTTKPLASKNDEKLERTKYEKYGNPNVSYKNNLNKPKSVKNNDLFDSHNEITPSFGKLIFTKDGRFMYEANFKPIISFISDGTSFYRINASKKFYNLMRAFDKIIAKGKSIKNINDDEILDLKLYVSNNVKDIRKILTGDTSSYSKEIGVDITIKDLMILKNNYVKFKNEIETRFKPYEAAINQLKTFAEEGLKEAEAKNSKTVKRKRLIVNVLNKSVTELNKINSVSVQVLSSLNNDLTNLVRSFNNSAKKYHKYIQQYK